MMLICYNQLAIMNNDCLACRLNKDDSEVPGGTIAENKYWTVRHCIGPYGIGAMIIGARRHVESFADLEKEEAESFSPLLRNVCQAIMKALKPERIYINSWGESTRHLHFLLQPRYKGMIEEYGGTGSTIQAKMVKERKPLDKKRAKEAAEAIKKALENK